jgi:hypothetical protein
MKSILKFSEKDYIRLNLKKVEDLPDMLVDKAYEFFNIKVRNLIIKVRYSGGVSNSHGCPLDGETNWGGRKKDVPRSYPGWIGSIKASVNATEVTMSRDVPPYLRSGSWNFSASEILFNNWGGQKGFRGFHTGSGCPGSPLGECDINIGFYFFLSDFPMLQKAKILDSFKVGV